MTQVAGSPFLIVGSSSLLACQQTLYLKPRKFYLPVFQQFYADRYQVEIFIERSVTVCKSTHLVLSRTLSITFWSIAVSGIAASISTNPESVCFLTGGGESSCFSPFVFSPFVFSPFVFSPFVFSPFPFSPFVFSPWVSLLWRSFLSFWRAKIQQ